MNGVGWTPDTDVCVFDGLQNVIERCTDWYQDRLGKEASGDMERGDDTPDTIPVEEQAPPIAPQAPPSTLDGIEIFEAESITDRKSVFVGRACRILHPDQAGR